MADQEKPRVVVPVVIDDTMTKAIKKMLPAQQIRSGARTIMHLHKSLFGFMTDANNKSAIMMLSDRCRDPSLSVKEINDSLRLALDLLEKFDDIMGKYMATGENGLMITPKMIHQGMVDYHVKDQFDSLTALVASLEAELSRLRGETPGSPRSCDESAPP